MEYRVELEAYSGPLDLLLFLVKRHEIDLQDIEISKLTEQYLNHLEIIKTLDMENVGEFLVMAATLLEIKSQMLLPRTEENAGQPADGTTPAMSSLDPRYELVQQLLAYKRYKDAAATLERRRDEWDKRFAHLPAKTKRERPKLDAFNEEDYQNIDEADDAEPADIDLDDVNMMDLCEAFGRILSSIGQAPATHNVTYDDTPIALHAEDIVDRLHRDGKLLDGEHHRTNRRLTLKEIFVGRTHRSEMVGLFLAVLELVRQRRVKVLQEEIAGDITLELRPKEEQQADEAAASGATGGQDATERWRNPQTGQIEYEWASEEDRKRAERRAKLRAKFAEKRAKGEKIDEDAELAELAEDEQDRAAIIAEESVEPQSPGS